MDNVYETTGRVFTIGTSRTVAPAASAVTGDMSEAITYSQWIDLASISKGAVIELLWNGNPEGGFAIKGSVRGPGADLGLDLTTEDPDGTTYAGDLAEDDLRAEDLGTMLVNISGISFPWIRVVYTRVGGSGFWAARIHEKQ